MPMANATVEIRILATNVTRSTSTSTTGEFNFVALQPGPYTLTVKQGGFKERTQNFELAVDKERN